MRNRLILKVGSIMCLLFLIHYGNLNAQNKANILILFVDDLGHHDLSCNGSEIYQTPHIDQLADQSLRFNQAYSNYPRCVPSRFAMMTGNYPVVGKAVPEDGFNIGSIEKEQSFIHQFRELGYRTAFFGKWHLGEGKSGPESIGYDRSIAAGKAGSPISFFYPFNEAKGHNRKVRKDPMIMNFNQDLKDGDYLTDILTNELIAFMDESNEVPGENKPFFAFMSFYGVHQPLEAKKKDVERNRKEIKNHDFGDQPEYIEEGTGRTKMRQDNPNYAAMVENLDRNIGRVMDFLDEKCLDKNTIVVFSSDHGGLSNDGTKKRTLATSNYPLRAGKGWMYEGGIKVPLYVRHAGKIKPRIEKESMIMLMDVLPTLLEMNGGNILKGLDSKSFLPVIEQKETWHDRTIYWHASKARPVNTGESKSSVIRSGDYKLIHFYEKDRVELYNVIRDPSERNNLSSKKRCKTRKLFKKLNLWKENW